MPPRLSMDIESSSRSEARNADRSPDISDAELASEQGLKLKFEPITDFHLLRGWLQSCSEHHQVCKSLQHGNFLPARVIDITSLENGRVKIRSTNDLERGPYAALSYCWGRSRLNILTLATLMDKEKGMELSSLAATIRDAILVARSLAFRYLWVDSLCIIQDSPEDKAKQLLQMSAIYKNSSLTIIAASVDDATAGFLELRTALKKEELRLYEPGDTRKKRVVPQGTFNKQYDSDNNLDPTETRAWCLQEGLLSPRCVVFSSLRMFWRCQELAYADHVVQVAELPALKQYENIHHFLQSLPPVFQTSRRGDSLTPADLNEIWTFWVDTLVDYTHRRVTYLTDRFNALSAIVTEIQALTGDEYLAGLWSRDIWKGLLWAVDFSPMLGQHSNFWRLLPTKPSLEPRPTASAQLQYLAPTWSWASVLGHVNHISSFKSPDFHSISHHVSLKNVQLPLGEILGATLRVRGKLGHAIWTKEVNASGAGHHWLTNVDHGSVGGRAPSMIEHIWSSAVFQHLLISDPDKSHSTMSRSRPMNLPSFEIGNSWFPPASPWRYFTSPQSNMRQSSGRVYGQSNFSQERASSRVGFPQPIMSLQQATFSIDQSLPQDARAYPDTWEGFAYENDRRVEEVYTLEVGAGVGLILKPVLKQKGAFQRVGFYTANGNWFLSGAGVEELVLL